MIYSLRIKFPVIEPKLNLFGSLKIPSWLVGFFTSIPQRSDINFTILYYTAKYVTDYLSCYSVFGATAAVAVATPFIHPSIHPGRDRQV